jgi:SAM-dependent methyltransferase
LVTDNSEDYRSVARAAWQQLAGPPDEIVDPGTLAHAAEILDPDGWISWDGIETALCLAGGGGVQAPLIAALGPAVTVLDISPRQLDRDRAAAEEHALDIECVEAEMTDLTVLGDRVFDLVYQPISTCYIPDVAALYRAVASVTAPGSRYWSEHWSGAQIQLDEAAWDGSAYRISHPVNTGEPLLWHAPDQDDLSCWHFAHSPGRLLGELGTAGFVIDRLTEPGTSDVTAAPETAGHLSAYLPPFLRVLARRR